MLVIKNIVFVQHMKKLNYKGIEKFIEKIIGKRKFKRVVIKPNLCFFKRIPGATTSAELIKYMTRYFVRNSKEVFVVESDGLLNTADEAFDNLGIRKVVEAEGGKVINLSKQFDSDYLKRPFSHDLFVNLPVLKTHEFTLVTGAIKNMFGMIPKKKRIKYHPVLSKTLVRLCRLYKNQLIIVDGLNAMEGHGPTKGRKIKMNILIGGRKSPVVDSLICKIMSIPIKDVPHIKYACEMFKIKDIKVKTFGIKLEKIIRKFKRPQLDPMTATKMWVWRHSIPNNIFFASPLYPIIRIIGIPIRKFTRWLLRMEKID